MSERILKALIQLFAIVARVEPGEKDSDGRVIVESFLKERLPNTLLGAYMALFEEYLETYQKISSITDGARKRTAVNSVKVLRICTQINEELTQRQKTIVLIRLLEFVYSHHEVSQLESEFIDTVADTFNFDMEEYRLARYFVEEKETELINSAQVMYITDNTDSESGFGKHFLCKGLEGYIRVLRLPSVNMHFIKYRGSASYNISGQAIFDNRFYILNQGAAIRGAKIKPIYYSDIIGIFLQNGKRKRIVFRAEGVMYRFKRGNVGLQEINLTEESGRLVGIMGASGSGKSTLLNVLNGNLKPSRGRITINEVDIHSEQNQLDGLIGYVAQDDLLIEELSVFENLYFNARLCFGQKSKSELTALVDDMLSVLGLTETRLLKVGNPLDKTISGGQRKRLNIALELIREPAVLFVDEPTSGLSSRDSENIMDLLKELSLKGKLIFVVIHQPSSDIFKMFDRLFLLDQGGYPIYYGNPADSLVYFKSLVNHVNCNEAECALCGNVKTEDIFNIVEARVVDEFGNLTHQRKVTAQEWNERYQEHIGGTQVPEHTAEGLPENGFTIPSKLKQYAVFATRDLLAKLTNRQYVLINLLEAPVLAMILAFFMRFFVHDRSGGTYIFRENENIPVYIFISVIVALFIGLTVSSEEIIRDKKIRKRESFLNLSRGSYLYSKISILLGISALQMLLFVVVGNSILEIRGMTFHYWLVLFSTCAFASILGLNISASFNSAKVIYILIPIVIIPQLLFSGIIVKFDKLNPLFASQSGVPWIGNIMTSRWAYEALAVAQYKWNDYEKEFYEYNQRKKFSNWKKDYWITELRNKVGLVARNLHDESSAEQVSRELALIKNEIKKENAYLQGIQFDLVESLRPQEVSPELLTKLQAYLDLLTEHYKHVYLRAEEDKEAAIYAMTRTSEEDRAYRALYNNYKNDQLETFTTNRNDLEYIAEYGGHLIQKRDLIYRMPYNSSFFGAHFYAPGKPLGQGFVDTFYANLIVIWSLSLALVICLFFNVFPRIIAFLERAFSPRSSARRKSASLHS